MQAEPGDLLLIVADTEDVVCASLGALRSHLGGVLKLYTNWWERKAAAGGSGAGEEEAAAALPVPARRLQDRLGAGFPFVHL